MFEHRKSTFTNLLQLEKNEQNTITPLSVVKKTNLFTKIAWDFMREQLIIKFIDLQKLFTKIAWDFMREQLIIKFIDLNRGDNDSRNLSEYLDFKGNREDLLSATLKMCYTDP